MADSSKIMNAAATLYNVLVPLSEEDRTRVLRTVEAALAPVAIIKQRGRPPGSKNRSPEDPINVDARRVIDRENRGDKPTREEYVATNAELREK